VHSEQLSSTTSVTSTAPRTPDNSQLLQDQIVSFSTDPDVFSSLEVEVSFDTTESKTENVNGSGIDHSHNQTQYPYANIDPATPQRASQIFGFLNENRYLPASSASQLPSHDFSASRSSLDSSREDFNRMGIKPLNAILRTPSTQMIHTPPDTKRMGTPQFPYAWEEDLKLAAPSLDRPVRGTRPGGPRLFSRFGSIPAKVDLETLVDMPHWTDDDKFTSLPVRRLRHQNVSSVPTVTQKSGTLEEASGGKKGKAQYHVKGRNILNCEGPDHVC
jgi:hypothetical protein